MRGIEQKTVFYEAIKKLCQVFNTHPTKVLVDAYWMALEDLDLDAVVRATHRAVSESEHMPRPVHIRRLAGVRSPEAAAQEAWVCFDRARRRHSHAHLDFEDSLINATVRAIGGRTELSKKTVDEWVWVKKDFLATYARYLEYPPTDELRAPLPRSAHSVPVFGAEDETIKVAAAIAAPERKRLGSGDAVS